MDLTPYLDSVAADLDRATALADDHTRDIAHRLASAVEPGLRLALLRAVTDAAAQINAELDDAVVTVAVVGRDPFVTVTPTGASPQASPAPVPPAGEGSADDAAGGPGGDEGEAGGTARITLRLPEQLKTHAEDLSSRAGQSLNTWLVQAVRQAAATDGDPAPLATRTTGRRHIVGWA